MADPTTGKFLYDMVAARLTAHAADQAALVGRAKDLLGVAVISTTITGVLANDSLTNVTKRDAPAWLVGLMAAALVTVVWGAFVAMRPRTWYLSPDPSEVFGTADNHRTWPVDTFYATIAVGFLKSDVVVTGKSALDHNQEQIRDLREAVLIQIGALAVLACCGLGLAWNGLR